MTPTTPIAVTRCPTMDAYGYRRGSWAEMLAEISPVPAETEFLAPKVKVSLKTGRDKAKFGHKRKKWRK